MKITEMVRMDLWLSSGMNGKHSQVQFMNGTPLNVFKGKPCLLRRNQFFITSKLVTREKQHLSLQVTFAKYLLTMPSPPAPPAPCWDTLCVWGAGWLAVDQTTVRHMEAGNKSLENWKSTLWHSTADKRQDTIFFLKGDLTCMKYPLLWINHGLYL